MWEFLILFIVLIGVGWYYLTPGKPKPCPCSNKNIGQL